jgi:hypothetical protein
LIEFGLLVLEKIFKNFQCIFTLSLLPPLGEGQSPSFETPPPKMICAKSGQNWPCGSGEEVENVKVYRRTTGDQNSSLELLPQVS